MSSLREALTPIANRYRPAVREHEILRVSAQLAAGDDQLSFARTEVLKWAQRRAGRPFPDEAWEHRDFEQALSGRNISAARLQRDGVDIWAIRSDDPDKSIPGRVWTTEVVLATDGVGSYRFATRLLASSPEIEFDIEPSAPGLVIQIADNCGLFDGPYPISASPGWVTNDEHAERLLEMLVNPARRLPIIALSCPQDNDHPLIDPKLLAKSLAGMAHILVLDEHASWQLTERYGKQYSVFLGAVRTYWPGFTDGCSPFPHRLMLADRLTSPELTKRAQRVLRETVAHTSVTRISLGQDAITFNQVKRAAIQAKQAELAENEAPPTQRLENNELLLESADARIKELETDLNFFAEEHRSAEERAENAEQQLAAAIFRNQRLLETLIARGDVPDADVPMPTRWGEFCDWCDNHLIGRVLLAPNARRQVKSPLFKDVETAARCLLWLANEGRDRRINGGAGSLADAPVLDGIYNTHCGGDTFRFDWQGRRLDADWHIKNGGNTRDPERCLRIYYSWDDITQTIVVAAMPAHKITAAS